MKQKQIALLSEYRGKLKPLSPKLPWDNLSLGNSRSLIAGKEVEYSLVDSIQ